MLANYLFADMHSTLLSILLSKAKTHWLTDWRADQRTGKLCLAQRQVALEGKASPHF